VVNVSAVLFARLFPVFEHADTMRIVMGVWAASTAIIATLIMTTQSDVKKKLVYSTVAQMGFMLLQCSTLAIACAIFHLVGHSLAKCTMVLQSSSSVQQGLHKRRWSETDAGVKRNQRLPFALLSLAALPLVYWLLRDASPDSKVTLSVMCTAAAFASTVPALKRIRHEFLIVVGLAFLGAIFASAFLVHRFEDHMSVAIGQSSWIISSIVVFFAVVNYALIQVRSRPFGARLYAASMNEFYLDEIVDVVKTRATRFFRQPTRTDGGNIL
jgi:NADH:ubiquinone oxidoreductase subunit 5 (subunit L)/multisubunit Na+/H+ antiporter MnhA subunit